MIANAVAHRIYLDPVNIQVALYDNRLEITSPGMLMNGVTIEKMKEGYSKIRNRAIANAFSYMKIIEKWDSGIPRIIRECQEYGIPEPELIDFDGDFRINMYRQPSLIQAGTIGTNSGTIGTINGIKVTSPEERVLTIMKQKMCIRDSHRAVPQCGKRCFQVLAEAVRQRPFLQEQPWTP